MPSFSHSWLIIGFVTRVVGQMPHAGHLGAPNVFSGVRVTRSLVFCSHRFYSYKRLQKWLNDQISNYNNNCKIIGNFKQTIDLKRTAWKYYRGNRRKTDNTMVKRKTGQTPMTQNITNIFCNEERYLSHINPCYFD
jgi:hypothetical protein